MKLTNDPESSNGSHAEYQVRVIDRVVAILDELARGGEMGDVDLAQCLGLHKSTVHRLLCVMGRSGLVERRPGVAKYRLGYHLFELGESAAPRLNMSECARPYVAQLVKRTGETAHLGVLRQGHVVSLVNVESGYSVHMPATVGRQMPLHCTSQGKAILAHLESAAVDELLRNYQFRQYCRNTISDKERLLGELVTISERGYAVDNEEFEEGLRCIAAPVRNHQGDVQAAISIAGPSFRVSGARIPGLSREVMRVAADLSAALGFQPGVIPPGA